MALLTYGVAFNVCICFLHGFACELSPWKYRSKYVTLLHLDHDLYFNDFLVLCSVFFSALMAVLLISLSSTGMAGLAVTYGLNMNARLSRWILSFCKLENKIISIERIHQYCQIPSEAPAIIEETRPPSSWPETGTIELIDLKVYKLTCFLEILLV